MHTRTEGAGKQVSRLATRKAPAPVALTPEQVAARDHARHEVDQLLRVHGIQSRPHFDEGPGEEKVLYVNVAFATALRERNVVFGLLEQQGWAPDAERLSRVCFAIETIRVRHKDTGARMAVVVRIPTGESMRREVVE